MQSDRCLRGGHMAGGCTGAKKTGTEYAISAESVP